MEDSRRLFLKLTGLGVLGGVGGPALSALAKKDKELAHSRMAMVVDTTRCLRQEGCTDCVTACHHVHNVPNVAEPVDPKDTLTPELIKKRMVKWIWKEPFHGAFPTLEQEYAKEGLADKEVLVFCNHCDNPPCVRVCPTQATFKRESDGIVMMDMHRCVGCRYCVVACPYGSRSFNWLDPRRFLKPDQINPDYPTRTKGVVEKCTFCEDRVSEGKQPACVEACKHGALTFGDLEDENSAVRRILRSRYTIRRKPGLGTQPSVYYIV